MGNKKTLALLATAALVTAMALVGCGGSQASSANSASSASSGSASSAASSSAVESSSASSEQASSASADSAQASSAASAAASSEAASSASQGAASLKDNPEEAKHQVEVAMQYLLEEAYDKKVNDARINEVKIYTTEEEKSDEMLKSYNLGPDEVAFEVSYELHPAEGVDARELTAGTGEYDEKTGWVVEKYNVGILRPNPNGNDPAYIIDSFGTAF